MIATNFLTRFNSVRFFYYAISIIELRKRFFYTPVIVTALLQPIAITPLLAELPTDEEFAESGDEGFKINFNNISLTEFIRFISRITGANFIFDETELQFKVTIISEEPISRKNIMSVLVQVLRIHNLYLLEQDNSLLITSVASVTQVPTIVSPDLPESKAGKSPIITQILAIR